MHFGNNSIKIYQYYFYDAVFEAVMSALFSICEKIVVLDGWVMLDGELQSPLGWYLASSNGRYGSRLVLAVLVRDWPAVCSVRTVVLAWQNAVSRA